MSAFVRQASRSGSSSFRSSNEASVSLPISKPVSRTWFTGQPQYSDLARELSETLHSTRHQLFHKHLLPSYSANAASSLGALGIAQDLRARESQIRWQSQQEISTQIGAKLSLSQYRNLVATLNGIRAVVPIARVADQLGLPYSSGDMSVQLLNLLYRFRKPSLESQSDDYTARQSLDEHGRAYAVGRRKESSARVWMIPVRRTKSQTATTIGQVLVNGLSLADYFSSPLVRQDVLRPFLVTNTLGKYNVFALSNGGGPSGQAGAVRLAIAKALAQFEDKETIKPLHEEQLLRRDPRMVERKKTGQPKARKKNTWVKR